MRRILPFVTLISLLISNMGISGVFANVIPKDTFDPTTYQSTTEIGNSVASQTNNSPATTTTTTTSNSTTSSTSSKITVITTEEIPGANCTCIAQEPDNRDGKDIRNGMSAPGKNCDNITTRKYSCEVTSGMSAFQKIMGSLIKWFIYIIMLLGVLAIVGAGIMMTFGSDSEEYTKKAKGWAMNIVIGLVILFTFSYILKLLAPWIYQ